MVATNADIANLFNEIADLLDISGDNPFRVRAYRNAARTVVGFAPSLKAMLENGEDLTKLPGIGKELAAKIDEIIRTGTFSSLTRLERQVPATVRQLLRVPGLGPKRVAALYRELNIENAEQLLRACREGRVRALAGFSDKTEQKILEAVAARSERKQRFKLAVAEQYAAALVEYLSATPGVGKVVVAGSYRRGKETVGDLDLLVTARSAPRVMARFTAYPEIERVLSHGPTRSSVVLGCGLQIDVRVVKAGSFGAALHYFTGSKAHNIAIRRFAQKRGLKINEYGVFQADKQVAGRSEESVFKAVGLPYIAPELREDQGEANAAERGALPCLLEMADLRGDLHAHTKATDGRNTLEEMAQAARQAGYEYLAITDHSQRLSVARGLDPRRLREQMAAIDRLNAELADITLLKGIEVDILEDGTLDLPDDVLGQLDLVIGAVHSKFDLPRSKQTERIVRAMEHPHFTILAHPSGRLIGEREPYDVDMAKIIRQARKRGCFLELNAHPERLDLNDTHCRLARETGVLVSINSDAHSTMDLGRFAYGVRQARRGWLEKADVLNTRPLAALRKLLQGTM